MNIVVYDLETTGLSARFDQPIQFAAARLEDGFAEAETVDILARPQNHILPAPAALATHGQGIDEILAAPISHYELMARLSDLAARWSPALWLGFNSLRFDEEMLRHSFYSSLRLPYATQRDGNRRADLLRVAQLVVILEPGVLTIPTKEGKPTFNLTTLAAANGLERYQAHDALGDVRATADLLRRIAAQAPMAWRLILELADRHAVAQMLAASNFVLVVKRNGARPVAPLGPNPDRPNEWLGLDLSADPTPLLNLPVAELAEQRRRFCRIRTNAMPLLLSSDHAAVGRLLDAEIAADVARWARSVRAAWSDNPERVRDLAGLLHRDYPPATHVEDRLYEGDLFPLRCDEDLLAAFHAADPADKPTLLAALQDDRARQLGRRIVYNEWPELLSVNTRAKLNEGRLARLHAAEAPWTSIPAALAEIGRMLPEATPTIARILTDYRRWLEAA
jgi:exodeoxyribonuclease-1